MGRQGGGTVVCLSEKWGRRAEGTRLVKLFFVVVLFRIRVFQADEPSVKSRRSSDLSGCRSHLFTFSP